MSSDQEGSQEQCRDAVTYLSFMSQILLQQGGGWRLGIMLGVVRGQMALPTYTLSSDAINRWGDDTPSTKQGA